MRLRIASIVASLISVGSASAIPQGASTASKIATPSGWPVIGYLIAGVFFAAAITLSLKTSTRSELEDTGT